MEQKYIEQVYEVLQDYDPVLPHELTLRKGDKIIYINETLYGWMKCIKGNEVGWVMKQLLHKI